MTQISRFSVIVAGSYVLLNEVECSDPNLEKRMVSLIRSLITLKPYSMFGWDRSNILHKYDFVVNENQTFTVYQTQKQYETDGTIVSNDDIDIIEFSQCVKTHKFGNRQWHFFFQGRNRYHMPKEFLVRNGLDNIDNNDDNDKKISILDEVVGLFRFINWDTNRIYASGKIPVSDDEKGDITFAAKSLQGDIYLTYRDGKVMISDGSQTLKSGNTTHVMTYQNGVLHGQYRYMTQSQNYICLYQNNKPIGYGVTKSNSPYWCNATYSYHDSEYGKCFTIKIEKYKLTISSSDYHNELRLYLDQSKACTVPHNRNVLWTITWKYSNLNTLEVTVSNTANGQSHVLIFDVTDGSHPKLIHPQLLDLNV